ncbi:dipeptide/oligopeptide/nickel ABC transporter ATP-binding protein [Planctomycetales bacterium]|nr:dipeptide/oligopeptide/nickel ABC transporter ATP-binding protein [Planctomycetales bacterium]
MSLLKLEDLTIDFAVEGRVAHVARGVSLTVAPREVVGLVGESGCGKSVVSLAIMGLLETPPARIAAAELTLNGKNLLALNNRQRRAIRGREMAMIFQEPMTSLNPVYTVGDQLREAYLAHNADAETAASRALAALDEVHIPNAKNIVNCYPHELSGGMKQRVMIAMALICRPSLLLADEPTTALDVTVQAQILALLREIRATQKMGMLFITHDLGVIAELADRVCVMYAGRIVERAPAAKIFAAPQHPYTRALLKCVPKMRGARERLYNLAGTVPSPFALPPGCKFAPRCEWATPECRQIEPDLRAVADEHCVACRQVKASGS